MIIWELWIQTLLRPWSYLMSSIVGIKVPSFIITAAGTAKIRAAINNGPEVKKIKFTDGQRSFLKI
jgi:20S proteasome alpha/beta subunit